jgi:2-polyprenyl-3-methyl-5-hydroxy-6-metoxy-1,4-benzoquinol methylase
MKRTPSGDYILPGPFECWLINVALSLAKYTPNFFRARFLRRAASYQVSSESELGSQQGLSINKWNVLQMPASLVGKTVLDIGCADGFFCQLCAQRGAARVVGIDSAPGRLLGARFAALEQCLDIEYRMEIFPSPKLGGQFDLVLCLSVLHHSLTRKDVWKVLTRNDCTDDLCRLRRNLKALRALTVQGGKCLIEMPYEYDDPSERNDVDYHRLNHELLEAGFLNVTCLGSWEHNEIYRRKKDRIIYAAEG